jgi:hypothetical protein
VARDRRRRNEVAKLDATPPWETKFREEPERTTGPYDELDAPADDLNRVDLGALRVPVEPGLDVRLEVNEQQQVVAVTLVAAAPDGTLLGSVQVGVYAAPRNEGIWDEVRAEIAQSMNAQKGQPKEVHDGPWGTELVGKLPSGPGGTHVPVRFVGIDGPRWFVRALFAGAPAVDKAAAEQFERALRNTVVVRGNSPQPVREPVPLTLPKGVQLPGQDEG